MAKGVSPQIIKLAPVILGEIRKAGSVLLHCHPSPDPDSVGSALAMKAALEQLGKKATIIGGDSTMPVGFEHFPGVDAIVPKNFFEIDLADFDLFIILDSGSPNMISRFKPIEWPLPNRTIAIDHHLSNPGFADINLIEPGYPATAAMLHDLFALWKIRMTPEMASNLFIGIYADTGGFRFEGSTARTFTIAAELASLAPDFSKIVSLMENSNTPAFLAFEALALDSVEVFLDGKLALSVIPHRALVEKKIPLNEVRSNAVSLLLRSVAEWKVTGTLIEIEPGKAKMSFRTADAQKYDVSRLAVAFGGGGHAAASGATADGAIDDVKSMVVAKAKELYNL
ncbi:MAG: bifunctional oligoribonuclease and phosphatase NrnA [Candidatus Parcubacteria bacterium]|jgi:phosphoesterase RecJ-like protein|nr:bifunctional oligoribonuclease and phosphatase NrnA [Candidatus Parcubacteria bacterium]